ncbi:replication protein A 32 kDa subunit-like protein [Dinothrombium tinctorium]|uniref:Replication protein A 32 kDa subunit-like protein n=1 Tax=Dinothrombium tinctorium TaxID=1965070 RepID=A0A3S4RD51_9ACAR|nr:replication protein A 32 kDa subunit-like protein [Dinothrombium tinctorium]RWS09871.1 replication protein A 32 kDa subunit-like protein [Dinothrombium tinctorium]RWS09952.1 replication protein A 32 kDa subunit-like protein [Dinothrombium tinctorium]RWS14699.1 replication protein A 32 kDa subunit-like protein [Dinothrombium tinctorium]
MWGDESMMDESGAGFVRSEHETSAAGTSRDSAADRKVRNLVSVSVDQIRKLYDNESAQLFIHAQPVSMVTVVGMVESVNEQTTSSTFILKDETGPGVEVTFWTLEDKKSSNIPSIVENSYVRVFGQVRSKEGRVYVAAFRVIPITDYNEITLHHLEVIYDCKILEKAKLNIKASEASGFDQSKSNDIISTTSVSAGFSKADQLILETINKTPNPEGMSIQEICLAIRSLEVSIIKKRLEFLANEGHIYTTIDDDHYRSTDV